MLWRVFRPALSNHGSVKQIPTGYIRYLPSSKSPEQNGKPVRLFASTSTRLSEQNGRIHDVGSALKSASDKPCPITILSTIRTIRRQKKHAFAKLGDGSTTSELQVLLSPSQAENLATGTAVKITGTLQTSPEGLQQSHELHAKDITIIGACDAEKYPIQKKYQSAEFLRTLPHLRLRLPWNGLLARLRSEVEYSCSEWFHKNEYVRAHPPIITSSDCEGAGEVFSVIPASDHSVAQDLSIPNSQHFFRESKYLTVSSQLHLEAYVHTHRAVWTLSPTFRAERSDTPRHLSEFYMLEAELQTTSLSEVMDVVESLLRHVGKTLSNSALGHEILSYTTSNNSSPDVNLDPSLSSRWEALTSPSPYPRVTYTEAIKHLQTAHSSNPTLFTHEPTWGSSLALEHEKYLAASIGQNTTPVFITDYPRSIKPFYMLPSDVNTTSDDPSLVEAEADKSTVSSFDLLLPSLAELVGGSLREHRHSNLLAAMKSKNMISADNDTSDSNLAWYLGLREYGSIPHGGFGLGFDRLLCYLSGESNVRDTVGWPRWVGRCDG